MTMYNVSADLQMFYDEYVRLGKELRAELAGYRDLNIQRIKDGLDDLEEESGSPRPYPYDAKNQGGYAMHTLNKAAHDDDDYDIDVALLFNKDDLPDDPLAARQRVCDALVKRASNFSKDPEVRTNAVTVWYAGHHVDFAIYRTWDDFWGNLHIEHASTVWKPRDPMEFSEWFAKQVSDKSPKSTLLYDPKVGPGQMRRIVRFLKWFCRSRTSWCLPGGMAMSILVAETYRADGDRDDVALFNSLVALRDRLKWDVTVVNPMDSSKLTDRNVVLSQVSRLRDQLDIIVPKLSVLADAGCTREKARAAWDWVFNHEFWAKKESTAEKAFATLPYSVRIQCALARKHGGITYKEYPSGAFVLPKGIHLRFSIAKTNAPAPFSVRWVVDNEGDEAIEEHQQHWERTEQTCWTNTKYKGHQRMTCELISGNQILARAKHLVKISASGRWGVD